MFGSILPARKCFVPTAETNPLPDFANGWCSSEEMEALGVRFEYLIGEYAALDPAPGEETLRLSYLFGKELAPIASYARWCSKVHPDTKVRKAASEVLFKILKTKNLREICAESAAYAEDWGGEERRYIEFLGAKHQLSEIAYETYDARVAYNKHLQSTKASSSLRGDETSDARRRVITAERSQGDSELFSKIMTIRQQEGYTNARFKTTMLSPDQASSFLETLISATAPFYRWERLTLGLYSQINDLGLHPENLEEFIRYTDMGPILRTQRKQRAARRAKEKAEISGLPVAEVDPLLTKLPAIWVEEVMAKGAAMFQLDVERVEAGDLIGYKVAGDPGGFIYFDIGEREKKPPMGTTYPIIDGTRAGPVNDFAGFDRGSRPHTVVVSLAVPLNSPMTPDRVRALYHGTGHAFHQVLSRPRLFPLGGFSVERDFIEVPSMFMELKCPFISASKALGVRGSLLYSEFDFRSHQLSDPSPENLADLWYEVESKVFEEKVAEEDRGHEYSVFEHVVNGYGSVFYSYLVGEVLAAGFAAITGDHYMVYRRKVLEPGATKPAIEIVRDFVGDPTDTDDPVPFLVKKFIEETFPLSEYPPAHSFFPFL